MRTVRLVWALWLLAAVGHAELHCPAPSGGASGLEAIPAERRLTFLQQRLEREHGPARTWTVGWGLGYGALSLAQLAAVPATNPQDRVDLYVGAVASAIGITPLVATPLDTLEVGAAPSLEQGGCSALAEQEARFFRAADNEAGGRSLLMHGINVVYNLAAGLVLGWGFGHWISGAVSAAVGILLGEAQIWTQPVGLVADAERYRQGLLDHPEGSAVSTVRFTGTTRGVTLSWAF